MSGSWAPAPSPEVAWVELDGEVVAYHSGQHHVHLLNASGALLWQLLDGTATVKDLASDVSAVFGISPEAAYEQISTFVDQMEELGLVVDRDGGGTTG